ncbi:ABC transporter permease [Corynebacterium aquatimens]|uniref:ABC-2 type transport system permease protein n=1 Tax=Corynebacterium aquatimens TaxID=1190508 RepID=A0A931E4N1_9CORY|nr:ABC transporter permease [Corynebacterium aquatimens]MBG6122388.1 ABC-2 type transport system permease protein [Corynebacterium aquatimens]WJY65069.1 ABC-2 family transporter protein [Corynebacterium aquatimens]
MLNTMLSEITKLRTTASFWWTSAIGAALMLAMVTMMAFIDRNNGAIDPMDPMSMGGGAWAPVTVIGAYGLFTFVVTVMATMVVTTEYRFKVSSTNFTITPQRWQVALAKLLVYGLFSMVFGLILLVISYILGDAIAANPFDWTSNSVAQRTLWALPLTTGLVVMLCQGVGWLVRNSAGAITLVVGWQLLLEGTILQLIPKWGPRVLKYMPFQNQTQFQLPFLGTEWNEWVHFGIFAAWAIIPFIIGLVLLERRDA